MKGLDLRKSIIDLAIQGKLVCQCAEDGDARDLISDINLESMVNGRKVKTKNITSITDNDISFELPANWTWVKLGYVCCIARGGSPRPIKQYITNDAEGINWIKIGDTEKNSKYISSTKEKIIKSGISKSRMVYPGDFLLTNSMSFGRPYILKIKGCIHDGWLVISQEKKIFDNDYLYYLLSSQYAYLQFCSKVSGAVVKNLNSDKVANAVFPLPPLNEQKRIVNKLEKILPLVEEYGKLEREREDLDVKLPEKLKKSILQYAMQGKLVLQIPSEGTAEELYAKIQEEKQKLIAEGKLKKEKPLPEIKDEEIPFKIPKSWRWVPFASVVQMVGTNKNKILSKEIKNKGSVPVVSQGQTLIDGYTEDVEKLIKDIPAIMFGDHTRNVKYVDFEFVVGADGAKFFKPIDFYCKYLYFWTLYISQKLKNRGYARHFSLLKKEYIALPPYKEQLRIVKCLEQILPLVEEYGKLEKERDFRCRASRKAQEVDFAIR